MTIDRGRLIEKIDWLQIDQEYLEDREGEYLQNLYKAEQPRGRHNTEVAFPLLNQQPQVRFSVFW